MDVVLGLILTSMGTMLIGCAGFAWVIEKWGDSRNEVLYCWKCGERNRPTNAYCEACRAVLRP